MSDSRDRQFMGSDGKSHKPDDPDYWQARARELEDTVRELRKAIVDLQYRVAEVDGGDLHWPADNSEPPWDLPPAQRPS